MCIACASSMRSTRFSYLCAPYCSAVHVYVYVHDCVNVYVYVYVYAYVNVNVHVDEMYT